MEWGDRQLSGDPKAAVYILEKLTGESLSVIEFEELSCRVARLEEGGGKPDLELSSALHELSTTAQYFVGLRAGYLLREN